MRPRRAVRHALALPAALGLAAVLLVGTAETGPNSARAVPVSVSAAPSALSPAGAANVALDAASRRDVAARETLRLARAVARAARTVAARRHATLARASAALSRARRAHPAAASAYDAATSAVRRAHAALNIANRAAAASAAKLRPAKTRQHAADVAVTRAAAAVHAAQNAVDDLTTTGLADSPDLAAAKAELAAAKAALARATSNRTNAHRAYRAASARARHDRVARLRAAKAAHAADARRHRLSVTGPRGLATARSYAAQAGATYRHAASILHTRRLRAQHATTDARAASAAFRRASDRALNAVRGVARSRVCPPGNAYAGAHKKHVVSAPGLTITRYQKAGRTPMWVTSANLAGSGPQIRPGPLTPRHVSDRTSQASQLAGSRALAAVNGDFFNLGRDQSPWGPEVKRGGVVIKGFSAPKQPSLVISRSGLADIRVLPFDITLRHGKAKVKASSLNSANLPRNGIAVLTSHWGHASRRYLAASQDVREYVVNTHGRVTAVHARVTGTAIPAGGMVIVAQGRAVQRLQLAGFRASVKVSVSARVRNPAPGGVYSAIGVGRVLIHNGMDDHLGCTSDRPVARTIVGIRPGGQQLFVVTAQGQTDSATSGFVGLSVRQAQGLMRSLGAYDAAMFDGGGSTILTARFGRSYKMVSSSPGWVRPVPNSFAFWPR